jgi:uncharacterized protein DUF3987/CHC2-type zinc finger protein
MAQLGYGDQAKKSARCPFHNDSSASFSVFTGTDGEQRWKCFAGCGQGDAIDFLAKAKNLSNAEACREFMRLAGIDHQPSRASSQSQSPSADAPFDWPACVAAFTPEHAARLATWRGFSAEFVAWLHAQGMVGILWRKRIAFPVHNNAGVVVSCQYHRKEGNPKFKYEPTGKGMWPIIFGESWSATIVWAFESTWDGPAVMDKLGWHLANAMPHTAVIITRGAENGKLIAGLCSPDATIYAFAQNDPPREDGKRTPAAKWLAEVAAHCRCKCVHVVTPAPHKDPNEWTQAGATAEDIQRAIAEAQPVASHAMPDLHGSAHAVIVLPSDEDDEPLPAPFPVELLPSPMAAMVAAVAKCHRVPVALPGICALGAASAAIGAGLEVVSGPGRMTRANLFLIGSAESGCGKSETFRVIDAPLVDHQAALLEMWKEKTHPKLQAEIGLLNREITGYEKKAAKCVDPTERDRLLGELEFKVAKRDDLQRKSSMPCVIAQDVTTERLAVLLRDNREVMFSASADARKVVDNLLGRYSSTKSTDESFYLAGYSGDYVRVDRQGRDPVILQKPCISLCWLIQPDLMATMLDQQSLSSSGFLPRLLACHTHAAPRKIEGDAPAISDSVRSQWTQLIMDMVSSFHGAEKPHRFDPTAEARLLLDEFHNSIVDRRQDDLADVGTFAARYAEQAWRISVVFHAALHGTDAPRRSLDRETAENAVRLVEWFSDQQLDILARGRRQAAQKLEEQVFELLETRQERQNLDYITARDVHRARIVSSSNAAAALLARMEKNGLLTGQDVRPEHGGKTTRIYRPVSGKNPVPE